MPAIAPWKSTNQYVRVSFTVNLGDVDSWDDYDLETLVENVKASFLIMGRETGDGGRKHFQGYMEFAKKRYGKAIDKAFRITFPLPLSVHFEPTLGTAEGNIKYCSKEDKDPFTMGEPLAAAEVKAAKKSSIAQAMEDIANGRSMLEVAQKLPGAWAQYRRSLDAYKEMMTRTRSEPTQCIYLWGPTGTGKSMHAQELEPTSVYWTGHFLNGCRGGEEVLLFDDFDYKKMDWQMFLTMTDRYPMTVNIKGGFVNFAPKTIIFTSNSNPKDWYPDVPTATREAIHRRMDEYGEIRHLGTLVPKEQNILTKYLIKKDKEPGVDAAAGAAASAPLPPPAPAPMIIDLTADSEEDQETDDDDALSVIALRRRYANAYKGIVEDIETEDEGEDREL